MRKGTFQDTLGLTCNFHVYQATRYYSVWVALLSYTDAVFRKIRLNYFLVLVSVQYRKIYTQEQVLFKNFDFSTQSLVCTLLVSFYQ